MPLGLGGSPLLSARNPFVKFSADGLSCPFQGGSHPCFPRAGGASVVPGGSFQPAAGRAKAKGWDPCRALDRLWGLLPPL